MIDTEQLDAVERFEQFAKWMEDRRRAAGFTQEELAQAAGISHSYYTKIVSVGTLRRLYGDGSRKVPTPRYSRGLDRYFAVCV